MRVLIAEDESASALILRRTLEKSGHEVTVAVDGAAAWDRFQDEPYPLVISDWMMPRVDGPTLCRHIRGRRADSYTYVILLTSRAEREDRIAGLSSGADDFLEKPLGRGELAARVEIARRILAMQDELRHRSEETARLNGLLLRQNEHIRAQLRQVTGLNAELEQFAYIACHDLQEPLRKIQTFGSRLAGRCGAALGPQGGADLERIRGAAGRMQTLIRDLFALTQVDRAERPFTAVDLGRVAREVLGDLEARLEETGGRVELGELPAVPGDALQLRQLLQNLIGNGLKYHRPGVPPVVTVTAAITAGAGTVRLEVTDNGIGFEEQYLTKIFAPFQRLHGRGEYEGTGIGLAICRKIVDRHGGTITAHGVPGRGATFVADLPLGARTNDTEDRSEQ